MSENALAIILEKNKPQYPNDQNKTPRYLNRNFRLYVQAYVLGRREHVVNYGAVFTGCFLLN